MSTKDTLRHALITALIGALISFATVLFQEFVNILKHIPAELPGAIGGMALYLSKWNSLRLG